MLHEGVACSKCSGQRAHWFSALLKGRRRHNLIAARQRGSVLEAWLCVWLRSPVIVLVFLASCIVLAMLVTLLRSGVMRFAGCVMIFKLPGLSVTRSAHSGANRERQATITGPRPSLS